MICKRYFRVASIKYLLLLLFSSLIFLLTRLVKQYCNELGLVVFHLSYQQSTEFFVFVQILTITRACRQARTGWHSIFQQQPTRLTLFTLFQVLSVFHLSHHTPERKSRKEKIIEKYHREIRQPKWMIGCKDKCMGGANLIV